MTLHEAVSELLECAELSQDDLGTHTQLTIRRVRILLSVQPNVDEIRNALTAAGTQLEVAHEAQERMIVRLKELLAKKEQREMF